MSQRLIMVDDTDSSIHYTGQGWFQDTGSRDGAGNFGPTYKHILHGTKSDGSFSFQFNGTLVKIYGTNNRVNTTSGWDPRWECFIDNVSIGATDPFPYDENNWLLCGQTDLNDGLHTITVNVTSTTGQPFWFDYVQYAPSSSVSEETAYIVVDHLDPGIEYGIGWVALGGTANMTSNHGSELWFNFTGKGLSWISFIPTELPHNASSATYSIDGESPVSFNLAGLPPNVGTTVYNQYFFSTPQLSAGPHALHVVHGGNPQQTPLTLAYLIVTNTSIPVATTSLNSSPAPTASNPLSTQTASNGGGPPIGAIVGAIVGGVSAIVLALLFLFFYRQRQKRASQRVVLMPGPRPQPDVTPFMASYEPPGPSTLRLPIPAPESQTSYPTSTLIVTNPHPMHRHGPSAGELSYRSHSASDNSWGTVPSNTGAVRKQREPVNHPPVGQVIHEDSGVRFPPQHGVLDIPPEYSPI